MILVQSIYAFLMQEQLSTTLSKEAQQRLGQVLAADRKHRSLR